VKDIMTEVKRKPIQIFLLVLLSVWLNGCYVLLPSSGGGQTSYTGERRLEPNDVALPPGYKIEVVTSGLTFPSAVAFDNENISYVLEAGYSYGEVRTVPRLLRVLEDGSTEVVVMGENPPWNGLTFAEGAFYVAEGGTFEGGRILRVDLDGNVTPIVTGLPSFGDHHTNGPVFHDGWLYFSQGTATNSGVVGTDNADYGWLYRHPEFHDTPCEDITLIGQNYQTLNPLTDDPNDTVITGAFLPLGTASTAGQIIEGELPCGGSVMRVRPDGSSLELVAWGFRNPFGLAVSPDGNLYVTNNSYDERGSRPVYGTGDLLWRVERGVWYGWPEFHGERFLNDSNEFKAPDKLTPQRLLETSLLPPKPVARLGVHSSSNGFDFSRGETFGYAGQAFIAQFGDMAPKVGKVLSPVGFKIVRVDVATGNVYDFAANEGETYGPASKLGTGGLERPNDAEFDSRGEALYIVDFGVMTIGEKPQPQQGTGVLWRVTRE
jgi:glucose/arabinose dehydrogenase